MNHAGANSSDSGADIALRPMGAFARLLSARESRWSAADSSLAQVLRADLVELIDDHPPQVVSVDIFDTLLLRNNKCEARRYWEMSACIGERLVRDGISKALSVEDLFVARYLAMKAGYACAETLNGCREGQILRVLATQIALLGLPPRLQSLFLEVELAYEALNLKANDFLLGVLDEVLRSVPMVGLSDMYLGALQIQPLVDRLFEGRCRLSALFSSADIILNKRSGLAYRHVAEARGLACGDILHIGDNVFSDHVQAHRAGCRALLFPVAHQELLQRHRDLELFLEERRREGLDCEAYATL